MGRCREITYSAYACSRYSFITGSASRTEDENAGRGVYVEKKKKKNPTANFSNFSLFASLAYYFI